MKKSCCSFETLAAVHTHGDYFRVIKNIILVTLLFIIALTSTSFAVTITDGTLTIGEAVDLKNGSNEDTFFVIKHIGETYLLLARFPLWYDPYNNGVLRQCKSSDESYQKHNLNWQAAKDLAAEYGNLYGLVGRLLTHDEAATAQSVTSRVYASSVGYRWWQNDLHPTLAGYAWDTAGSFIGEADPITSTNNKICLPVLIYCASHSFNWTNDASYHWQECSKCGYIQNKSAHTSSDWLQNGASGHYKKCTYSNCGRTLENTQAHYDTNNNGYCDACNYEMMVNGYITLDANKSVPYKTSSTTFSVLTNHGGTLSVTDDNATATCSISGTTVTISNIGTLNVGTTVKVTVTCAATGRYRAASATFSLTFTKIDGYVTLDANKSVPYKTASTTFAVKTNHGGTLSVADDNSTATCSISGTTVTISNIGSINVGTTVKVTVTCAATTNYKQATATFSLTFTKINGSGSVTMADWTYGGTASNPSPSSSTNGTSNVSYKYKGRGSTSYTESTTKPTNAGTYTITATFATTTNYNAVTATADFTINKANGYVKLSASSGRVRYGTSSKTFTVSSHHGGTLSVSDNHGTATSSISGTTVTIGSLGGLSAGANESVCPTITVTVKSAATTNYKEASATYVLKVVDDVAPTGSISVNNTSTMKNGKKAVKTRNITLAITYSDAGSSVDKMAVFEQTSNVNSILENPSTSKSFTLSTGDGEKTVYLVLRDTWGNMTAIPTN